MGGLVLPPADEGMPGTLTIKLETEDGYVLELSQYLCAAAVGEPVTFEHYSDALQFAARQIQAALAPPTGKEG